jgi:oligoendopeptidase F
MSNTAIPLRKEIPSEDTWDLESIYSAEEDWHADVILLENKIDEIGKFSGTLGENPNNLIAFYKAQEDLMLIAGHIMLYARLHFSVDAGNQKYQKLAGQSMSLFTRAGAALSFSTPEIMKIGFNTLFKWVTENEDLAPYKHVFERMELLSPHIRSTEIEELLSNLTDPFRTASQTHGTLANADIKFKPAISSNGEEIELAHSNIVKLMSSDDGATRKSAWENYADGHLAYKNSIAKALSAGVKQDWFIAKARNYSTSLEAALKPNFIPTDVFHNLIDTYKENLPTWHKYWDIRRKFIGDKKLNIYDSRAALTKNMPTISFQQAIDWISEGLAPLGSDYVSVMRDGAMEQRWIDKYPNKGKRFGAFSSGWQGTHPFIMMSYNNDIFGLSTLAHELGHSMHSYYTKKNQPAAYTGYGLFAAEVASNFNQAMVRSHLLSTLTDRDMQIAIIEEAMANFRRYFFIMPTLARFELEIHERTERGEGLTAESMNNLLADLFTEGYGPSVDVDRDRVGSVWMQFSTHLYSNFYVFQYATGISGAHSIAEKILTGSESARDNYLNFLKSGGSNYPLALLKNAGVDLSSPAPLEKTFEVLAQMVNRLEKLI